MNIIATHTDSPHVSSVWLFIWIAILKFENFVFIFCDGSVIFDFVSQVLIWNVESQPNRNAVLGAPTSVPDLVCIIVF